MIISRKILYILYSLEKQSLFPFKHNVFKLAQRLSWRNNEGGKKFSILMLANRWENLYLLFDVAYVCIEHTVIVVIVAMSKTERSFSFLEWVEEILYVIISEIVT